MGVVCGIKAEAMQENKISWTQWRYVFACAELTNSKAIT